jgi:NAD(P)H dehydrogenase (quinone)
MSVRVAIVYHSEQGHTAAIAEAVARGASGVAATEATLVDVSAGDWPWESLAASDAIVFGCPTHFGGISAEMKRFLEASEPLWWPMRWRDKIAAAFTCAGEPSGDKQGVIMELAIFACQHGMVWVGVDPLRDERTGPGKPEGYNRHGGYMGAMADAAGPELAPHSPPPEDRRTAELFGRRIAVAASRWSRGAAALDR